MYSHDIAKLISGDDWKNNPKDLQSSLLFLDCRENPKTLQAALYSVGADIPLRGKNFGGSHLFTPSEKTALKKAREVTSEIMKKDKRHSFSISSLSLSFERDTRTSFFYGEALIKKSAIPKLSYFATVHGIPPSNVGFKL